MWAFDLCMLDLCAAMSAVISCKIWAGIIKKLLKSICWYSSGIVTPTPVMCEDKAAHGRPSDCPEVSHLCHDPLYESLMKNQCPKTCGYCGDSTVSSGMWYCSLKWFMARFSTFLLDYCKLQHCERTETWFFLQGNTHAILML